MGYRIGSIISGAGYAPQIGASLRYTGNGIAQTTGDIIAPADAGVVCSIELQRSRCTDDSATLVSWSSAEVPVLWSIKNDDDTDGTGSNLVFMVTRCVGNTFPSFANIMTMLFTATTPPGGPSLFSPAAILKPGESWSLDYRPPGAEFNGSDWINVLAIAGVTDNTPFSVEMEAVVVQR